MCNVHLFDKQRGGAWKATRDAKEKGQGARGTVVVVIGILLHLSSMLAAIRHAGFLFGCPVLPQQRCCLRAAAVFGVIQGGAALCEAGRAVSGLRFSMPATRVCVMARIYIYMYVLSLIHI